MTDVGAFAHAPLFRGVDGETLRRLAADAQTITLRGGDYLFRGGEAAEVVTYVSMTFAPSARLKQTRGAALKASAIVPCFPCGPWSLFFLRLKSGVCASVGRGCRWRSPRRR